MELTANDRVALMLGKLLMQVEGQVDIIRQQSEELKSLYQEINETKVKTTQKSEN